MTGNRKTRDAVAAKLDRAQKADGMSQPRRAKQNKRVADKIEKQGKAVKPQKKS